ncbi:hypothetical protein I7I50_04629 [Histoplasma capsulatum G186AR]|uniref:Uncharacterized protein n=1 Tax=Ajellomyces capsulatus TaxID=5037 RepID=A0A8H8CXB8_AJECA|nr:hypothetical protein I7I52_05538 [Histoplasma capsulatum]QSS75483.1 hypothetical protein I7I50_04629 [Histoplasma capsulatum G186AR]
MYTAKSRIPFPHCNSYSINSDVFIFCYLADAQYGRDTNIHSDIVQNGCLPELSAMLCLDSSERSSSQKRSNALFSDSCLIHLFLSQGM